MAILRPKNGQNRGAAKGVNGIFKILESSGCSRRISLKMAKIRVLLIGGGKMAILGPGVKTL